MDRDWLRQLLDGLLSGHVSIEQALLELARAPAQDLGYATLDTHRQLRQGMPEVIYAPGKTTEQIAGIGEALIARQQNLLITRLDPSQFDELAEKFPRLTINRLGRTARFEFPGSVAQVQLDHPVAVVTAGTSDLPVAEEALETLAAGGVPAVRIADVGVAGIHRLLKHQSSLCDAPAVICVAGMEGALPSVVAGLTARPVVAVPTSIGYGVAFGGLSALFSMLTSCASGVTVVNIDNGFGAAMAVIRQFSGRPVQR